jgi:hypothetical protein
MALAMLLLTGRLATIRVLVSVQVAVMPDTEDEWKINHQLFSACSLCDCGTLLGTYLGRQQPKAIVLSLFYPPKRPKLGNHLG